MTETILARTARFLVPAVLLAACGAEVPDEPVVSAAETATARPEIYAEFALTADLDHLSDRQRQMIGVLIEASEIMDELFWLQAFGPPDDLAGTEEAALRFAKINYGPWDRLAADQPFVESAGPKPLGARHQRGEGSAVVHVGHRGHLVDIDKNPQKVEAEQADHDIHVIDTASQHADDDRLANERSNHGPRQPESIADRGRKQARDDGQE